jgi:hypothetical protein
MDPKPNLWLMDPDPGGPKTCGSGGSGSATMVSINIQAVLQIRDLVPFWPLDSVSWMGKKSGSGSKMNNLVIFSRAQKQFFGLKYFKKFLCGPGSGIWNLLDPGSGIRDSQCIQAREEE